jgi:hypothetical protein
LHQRRIESDAATRELSATIYYLAKETADASKRAGSFFAHDHIQHASPDGVNALFVSNFWILGISPVSDFVALIPWHFRNFWQSLVSKVWK